MFYTSYYRDNYPEVARSKTSPLLHYLRSGAQQGYNPNPLYELNDEIEEMSAHIVATLKNSDGRNELWKFFGLASEGELPTAELNPDDASMASKLDRLIQLAETPWRGRLDSGQWDLLRRAIIDSLELAGADGVHGSHIGRLAREYLGSAYHSFVMGGTLSGALRSIGVPIFNDDSGRFYLTEPESEADRNLEELKAMVAEMQLRDNAQE